MDIETEEAQAEPLTIEQVLDRTPTDSDCPSCGIDGVYEASEWNDGGSYQDAACANGHYWREISTVTHIVAISELGGDEIGDAIRVRES